jgi:hypothetical protein
MIIEAINNTDRDGDLTPTHSKNIEGEEVPASNGASNFYCLQSFLTLG